MKNTPKISVIMLVYNGEKYLKEAIESILNQTYTDFEFLIIDDGSTDNSVKIINSYKDERIILAENKENKGITYSRNLGLDIAKGEYIAVMDCDDISLPKRFEKQVKFMDENPEIGACGTSVKIIGLERRLYLKKINDPDLHKCKLLFEGNIVNPSAFIRRKAIQDFNLFYPDFKYAEDYAFWIEISKHSKITNLEDVLLFYRMHPDQSSSAKHEEMLNCDLIIKLNLYKEIGLNIEENEHYIIKELASCKYPADKKFVLEARSFLSKIKIFNEEKSYCSQENLQQVLSEKWYEICLNTGQKGLWTWDLYNKSCLSQLVKISPLKKVKLLFNLIIGKIGLFNLIRYFFNSYRNYKYKTKWK